MHKTWEGKPSQVPYLLFKADFLSYMVLAIIAMYLFDEEVYKYAIYAALLVCTIYSILKTNAITYYTMREGIVFKTLFRLYFIPWYDVDWNITKRVIEQFKCRTYTFAGEYQVARSKNAYRNYATMWYLKDYEGMTSAVLSSRHEREFDYEQK